QTGSRRSTTGCPSIGVSGSRASTRWRPTSKNSAKEKVMSARRKSVADDELLIVRTFNAPPSVVFEVWSNSEHLKRLLGPQDYTCTEATIDCRVVGRYCALILSPLRGEAWFGG